MRRLPVAAVYDRRVLGNATRLKSAVIDCRYSGMLLISAFTLTACGTCGLPNTMAQIKPGMKTEQVETILGRPASMEQSETTGISGEVYHYPCSTGEGRVVFLNNAVFKAEFVPGAKS